MRRLLPAAALLLFALPAPARATTVSALQPLHRDGQTFLVWRTPPGTGWRYRVYRDAAPITSAAQLTPATLVGAIGDSTWCDRRMSRLTGTRLGHRIDSLATPLDSSRALLVVTPAATRTSYYAVTAQAAAGSEDLTLHPGDNALTIAVAEVLALPRPVYQRTLSAGPTTYDLYTTWVSPTDTPLYPAMSTAHGLAFDHAVVRGTPGGPLHVRPHARGGNLLNSLGSSGEPGEWRLALDDWLFDSSDRNSFWYGYHPAYDLFDATPATPTGGTVADYTLRRIVHTFAWARRTLPVDTTRVIASGGSMGAIGSWWLAYRVPQWLAGVHGVVPKFDFSYTTDPNPANIWNAGTSERAVGDHLWGEVATDLPTTDGLPVYDRQNLGVMSSHLAGTSLPVMVAFNGRNDTVVGWGEKIGYYAATQTHRHGGLWFFDRRTHSNVNSAWVPMQIVRNLYRYRTNRSYPAFSNASSDHDPGDGNLASGDSVGTLNGALDWDTTLVDTPTAWRARLLTRSLTTTWGGFAAPETVTVDVTPRRLQAFAVAPGDPIAYRVERASDAALLQSGVVVADSLGLVTVPGVRVLRTGVDLWLGPAAALDAPIVGESRSLVLRALSRDGARWRLAVTWAGTQPARVSVHDVAGRRLAVLHDGAVSATAKELTLDLSHAPRGLYFVAAQQGEARRTLRVVHVR